MLYSFLTYGDALLGTLSWYVGNRRRQVSLVASMPVCHPFDKGHRAYRRPTEGLHWVDTFLEETSQGQRMTGMVL